MGAPTDESVSITIRLVVGSLMNNLSNVSLLLITFPPFVSMDPFWERGQAASVLTSKRKSMCLVRDEQPKLKLGMPERSLICDVDKTFNLGRMRIHEGLADRKHALWSSMIWRAIRKQCGCFYMLAAEVCQRLGSSLSKMSRIDCLMSTRQGSSFFLSLKVK